LKDRLNSLKISCQQKVDEIVDTIIGVYLEENIKQEGMTSQQQQVAAAGMLINEEDKGEGDDEDENF